LFASAGVERVDIDALLARSNYISVHAPLAPQTRGLLNKDAFAKMKKGVYIVNTARGPLIDEEALIAALDAGQVGGAALDVVTTEPLAKNSPLLGRDNVIVTPHTAFYSIEALDELQSKCATDVARVLSGEKAVYPISA
jgi:D-3-phosphoglycerate dehydrogenase